MNHEIAPRAETPTLFDRSLAALVGFVVVAEVVVVGLQVVGRHALASPLPWTEEVARVLLAWLMCVGGVVALRRGLHPRVTAFTRRLDESRRLAADRGLRLVLMGLFASLLWPSWRLTVSSAAETLPASGLPGTAITAVLPASLLLMLVALAQETLRDGLAPWRNRTSLTWSVGAASLAILAVAVPILARAPPLVALVSGFLVTAALGVPLAFTLLLTSFTYLIAIGGIGLIILPIRLVGAVDSFVLLAIPLFILGGALMESAGISERIVNLAMAIVGRIRGGLAMVTVVAEISSPAFLAPRQPTCRPSARCWSHP